MVTGRERFEKNKRLIMLFVVLFKLIPRPLISFLWDWSSKYSQIPFVAIRYIILKARCKSCGDNVRVGTNCRILHFDALILGSNISIHDNCYIDAFGGLSVGNDVSIAHSTSILTFEHAWDDHHLPIKYNPVRSNNVVINDDVWIGCGVRILSGVTISSRVVVAAGAVVTNDFPNSVIIAGVPARVVKSI